MNKRCDRQYRTVQPWGDTTYTACGQSAEFQGLLQVANPDTEYPEGIQVTVEVCYQHSYTWHTLWGVWPHPDHVDDGGFAETEQY